MSKLFNIGLAIVIISFFASITSYYLLYFTVPFFLIGVLLIILSKQSFLYKTISIVLPLLLYFPSTVIFLWIYNYSTLKVYLIPENYEGIVRVIYEEPCGIDLLKKDGEEVIVFSDDGIVILKNDFDGSINHSFYYLDKKGNKRLITNSIYDKENKLVKTKYPLVSISSAGSLYLNDNSKAVTYSDFYIEKKNRDDKFYQNKYKLIDSVTQTRIKDCRINRNTVL